MPFTFCLFLLHIQTHLDNVLRYFQSMELLQYLGLLEQQAQQLRRVALKLQAAALCGTVSTNFLNLMENFYGVDKEEKEGTLKDMVEKHELGDDEEEEDIEDLVSTTSSVIKRKTLKQLKIPVTDQEKYPSKCGLKDSKLFFPTSASTLYDTGVDSKYICTREGLSRYKGLYCCCDYGAQVQANTLSHIHRVHLGHAVGCRYCTTRAWW